LHVAVRANFFDGINSLFNDDNRIDSMISLLDQVDHNGLTPIKLAIKYSLHSIIILLKIYSNENKPENKFENKSFAKSYPESDVECSIYYDSLTIKKKLLFHCLRS